MELHQLAEYAADMTSWTDFIDYWCARRDTNPSRVAALAGYDKSLVTGWRKGGKPSVEYVRATALVLDAPVVQGMVAASYLEPGDVKAVEIERPVSDLDDEELLREIRRRLKRSDTENEANKVIAFPSPNQGPPLDAKVAANRGKKGVPDQTSEAEESQVRPDDDDE